MTCVYANRRHTFCPTGKVDLFDLFNKKWALTCVNAQNRTHFLSYNPHPSSPDIDKRDAYEAKKLPSGSLLKTASESISRVLSLDDHLSRTRVTTRLKHATRMHGRAAVWHSYLRLLQMGFSKPRCCQRAGALLPHRFSFSPACAGEFTFLWHFPSGRPAQPLAGILPCPAVSWHLALWSPDFPHAAQGGARSSGPLAVWYSTISEPKQGAS